jgi:short-subunit dehydrogenase
MTNTVILFGAGGGIGSATQSILLNNGYSVVPVRREWLDLTSADADQKIKSLLTQYQPVAVVNCAGHFGNNEENNNQTMQINFNSNWSIIQHYLQHNTKQTAIVMVGSSAYKSGKKDYMLYSASKAALYNLWQGARDYFTGTKISINLINPVRTKTKMVAPYQDHLDYLDPLDVAVEILNAIENSTSVCIDINFKETK